MEIPTLVTTRVTLRAFRPEDLEPYVAMWADPRVTEHIGGKPRSRSESFLRMLAADGQWRWFGHGFWAVEEAGRLIGTAGVAVFERDLDPPLADPEVGWAFSPACWGRGIASEVALLLAQFADDKGIPRTLAVIDHANRASVRVAEKAGYVGTGERVLDGRPVRLFERLAGARARA